MRARFTWWNPIVSAMLLALMAAAWTVLAPTRFGGQATYVIVSGISMEPNLHRGDLVILREADSYAIGDVVTYRHPTIGPVIHRIIGRDGERFIFKGDNNTWLDAYRPTQAELIGKLWIYVPKAGTVIEQVRIPRNLAALVLVAGASIMTTGTTKFHPGGRRAKRGWPFTIRVVYQPPNNARPNQARARAGSSWNDLLFILGTVAFAALLLGAFAFASPATRTVADQLDYTQTGSWSYSAAAPADLYDHELAQTGDPVFLQLANSVAVRFTYEFGAAQPADLRGTIGLSAQVSDPSGWQRTFELQPATAFGGTTATATGMLDLRRVRALIDHFEQQTGVQRAEYLVAVTPQVQVQGRLADQALNEVFAPRLLFELDRQMLWVQPNGADNQLDLHPTKAGLLNRDRSEENILALFGLHLPVQTARRLAVIAFALALGAGAVLAFWARRAGPRDEDIQIRRKYAALLVTARDLGDRLHGQTIEVATIDDLARLAERAGQMIVRSAGAGGSWYRVQAGDVIYLYRPKAPGGAVESIV